MEGQTSGGVQEELGKRKVGQSFLQDKNIDLQVFLIDAAAEARRVNQLAKENRAKEMQEKEKNKGEGQLLGAHPQFTGGKRPGAGTEI